MKYIDMHCDTISRLHLMRELGNTDHLKKNQGHVDLERMEKGECLAQNFALFTNLKKIGNPYEDCMVLFDLFEREMTENFEQIRHVTTVEEIFENERQGRMSAVLTIEEGAVCLGQTELLRAFYQKGVRMMTLTWNHANELAFPNQVDMRTGESKPELLRGLTEAGYEFVELMEELGMIVDVSHLGDAGFFDVARTLKGPFAASHSNARAVAGHARNLTDEMIRLLSERGGVMGVNFCPGFLDTSQMDRKTGKSRVADMVKHIKHIKNVGGIDCIGLGSDFDGIVGVLELSSPAALYLLDEELERQGFTIGEREKIFYGNVLRLYQEVWK